MDSSFSAKEKIWFLRVCHHISNAVYNHEKTKQNPAEVGKKDITKGPSEARVETRHTQQ